MAVGGADVFDTEPLSPPPRMTTVQITAISRIAPATAGDPDPAPVDRILVLVDLVVTVVVTVVVVVAVVVAVVLIPVVIGLDVGETARSVAAGCGPTRRQDVDEYDE